MRENQNDIQRMQQDAENRLREMQKRAERAVHGNDMPPVPNFVRTPYRNAQGPDRNNVQRNTADQKQHQNTANNSKLQKTPESDSRPKQSAKAPEGSLFSRFKGADILKILNFKNIGIDNDVLIIITLILLLATDDCDQLLILALVYIML